MENILLNLGYEHLEPGQLFCKEYKKCSICIDLNHYVILISTDGKGIGNIKRFSSRLKLNDEETIKGVLYAKIKFYLEEEEKL